MELLVVTLAYTNLGRDADILARIRLICDTTRNAPGIVTVQSYRSRGRESYYVLLTTWDSEESWQRARERYSPKYLLLSSATDLLTASPEQWQMHYLWGYSRPAASPILAAAHLAYIHTEQADVTQQGWIEGLRRQATEPTLAFAFLARGAQEDMLSSAPHAALRDTAREQSARQSSVFLNIVSWGSELDREQFYEDAHYKAIYRYITGVGTMQILPLEPMQFY